MLFATLYNTGARVSEVVGLRCMDVELDGTRCVRILGKGRKQRVVPLWSSTAARLKEWIARMEQGREAPLFPNRDGLPLSRSGVEKRLRLAVAKAAKVCPSLAGRRISPHTLRHTTAMHLLQSGVDMTVIALWLGHETPATTHLYVEADLTMKEQALKRVAEPPTSRLRYQANDRLLAFLDRL
jgi:site-specific recombinase XerD